MIVISWSFGSRPVICARIPVLQPWATMPAGNITSVQVPAALCLTVIIMHGLLNSQITLFSPTGKEAARLKFLNIHEAMNFIRLNEPPRYMIWG